MLIDRFFIKWPQLRAVVTRTIYGSKNRNVDLFGGRFVINSLRENGYLRAAHKAKSSSLLRDEVGVLLSLSTLLRPGDTFVDVGANIGMFSCTLNRINLMYSRPVIQFYAYEPHPDTFQRLQQNVQSTGIIARNLAASDESGQLEFVDGAVSHVFTAIKHASAYNIMDCRRSVSSVRLEEEPVEGDSLIIKIDVEGQELQVLEGAGNWFSTRRVKAVYLDGYGQKDRVESFLKHYGFDFFDGRSNGKYQGDFCLLAIHPAKQA